MDWGSIRRRFRLDWALVTASRSVERNKALELRFLEFEIKIKNRRYRYVLWTTSGELPAVVGKVRRVVR